MKNHATSRWGGRLVLAVIASSVVLLAATRAEAGEIHLWYGPEQRFGHLGEPQRWVNVLGHVGEPATLERLAYSINGGPARPLSVGCDLHRLAREGDFNVELAWDTLRAGENNLAIEAWWRDGSARATDVKLFVTRSRRWPLPYAVDFGAVEDLQDVVQVVDGRWRLTGQGVRTSQPYYDRVLSLGDETWTDYDATVRLTLHGFAPPEPGPPTYNVTHMGVALRWRGHTADGRQPSRRWYPLGAQGEFLVKPDLTQCRYRVLTGGGEGAAKPVYGPGRLTVGLERPFHIRAQVTTLPDGRSRYRFKQWNEGTPEPDAWAVRAFEPGVDDFDSGSLCLVPHNTDVTIHGVHVRPLARATMTPSTAP